MCKCSWGRYLRIVLKFMAIRDARYNVLAFNYSVDTVIQLDRHVSTSFGMIQSWYMIDSYSFVIGCATLTEIPIKTKDCLPPSFHRKLQLQAMNLEGSNSVTEIPKRMPYLKGNT